MEEAFNALLDRAVSRLYLLYHRFPCLNPFPNSHVVLCQYGIGSNICMQKVFFKHTLWQTLCKFSSLWYNSPIMKNYIIFDLEWNQSARGKTDSIEELPFEIIEIGAVKLDENFSMVDEFHRLICPQVYTQMHYAISEVTHMKMQDLQNHGEDFVTVVNAFIQWCGKEESVYCTWGMMDLTELQRNIKYFKVENPFPYPLFYYDVQKLYGMFYSNGIKPSLDVAVEELKLMEERPFHRALDDAYYTGRILVWLISKFGPERLLPYHSTDYYRIPESKDQEIHILFPNYSKYVSRVFPSKEDALKERSVAEMRCYECGRALRKKIHWFTSNQKIYYSLALCPDHGYLKGKIRMKRVDDMKVYVIKTLKLTDETGAEQIISRKNETRKKRAKKNREKRARQRKSMKLLIGENNNRKGAKKAFQPTDK